MTALEEQAPLLPQHKAVDSSYTTDKRPCCASRHRTDSQCCSKSMDNQEYCYLADQPWQMKAVALMCALLLAGKASPPRVLRAGDLSIISSR